MYFKCVCPCVCPAQRRLVTELRASGWAKMPSKTSTAAACPCSLVRTPWWRTVPSAHTHTLYLDMWHVYKQWFLVSLAVLSPDGFLYEKQAILEYILHHKTETAKKMKVSPACLSPSFSTLQTWLTVPGTTEAFVLLPLFLLHRYTVFSWHFYPKRLQYHQYCRHANGSIFIWLITRTASQATTSNKWDGNIFDPFLLSVNTACIE